MIRFLRLWILGFYAARSLGYYVVPLLGFCVDDLFGYSAPPILCLLPAILNDAREAQKIDAAAPKNAELLQKIIEMPVPATRKEAEAVVAKAHCRIATKKRQKRASKQSGTDGIEEFASMIVCQFESDFRTCQQCNATLRSAMFLSGS